MKSVQEGKEETVSCYPLAKRKEGKKKELTSPMKLCLRRALSNW